MRNNQPVINDEYVIGNDDVLISRSDLQGNITYANAVFVAVSGYSRRELMGEPHNILRHPDVPPPVFANLWKTLKAGDTWQGVLKNRRKDGGFYWVYATVAPLREGNQVVGYTSVRRRASVAAVDRAADIYADMWQHNGRLRGYVLRRGTLHRAGLRGWFERISFSSIKARLIGMVAMSAALLVLSGVVGYYQFMAAQMVVIGAGIALMVVLGAVFMHSLNQSFRASRRVAFQIAAGNVAVQVDTSRRDELGDLLRAIDIMRASLAGIAGDLRQRARTVASAADGIAADNESLSARTEQQAASLQQTAASMDELTTTVRQNTDSAREATRLAETNTQASLATGEQMQALIARMERIAESSSRMVSIISTIDSIAFQTNILALNASVEAARAGEAGRGFAVVASEVRTLAGRSASAASDIRRLIDETHREIATGRNDVQHAGKSLEEVVAQVRQVSELLQNISGASDEQSSGISEVNTAVNSMDQVTQQNASQVQAIATSAGKLTGESQALIHVVVAFRLAGSGAESVEDALQLEVGQSRH